MSGVIIGFAIIAFVIVVGYIMGRSGVAGPGAERVLNRVAFFVANPALLFTVLARANLHTVFSSILVTATVCALVSAAAYVTIARFVLHRGIAETTIGALGASYVNANNIGLPVAVYVLGSASYVAPILLIQLIVFAPVALAVLDAAANGHPTLRAIATQPLRNPVIIASLLGVVVALWGVTLPVIVLQPLELIGGAAIPLVLLAFGMSLHGSRPLRAGTHRAEVIIATILKSVIMPTVAYLLARFVFGLHGTELFAAVVLAALPAAQNVFNFASRYEKGQILARDTVLLTTVVSIPVLLAVAAILA